MTDTARSLHAIATTGARRVVLIIGIVALAWATILLGDSPSRDWWGTTLLGLCFFAAILVVLWNKFRLTRAGWICVAVYALAFGAAQVALRLARDEAALLIAELRNRTQQCAVDRPCAVEDIAEHWVTLNRQSFAHVRRLGIDIYVRIRLGPNECSAWTDQLLGGEFGESWPCEVAAERVTAVGERP